MITILRGGALAAVCGLLLLVTAGPASAHARLQSSDPADGASVATSPSTVTLTFNEQMQDGFAAVTVIGPGDTQWHEGEPTASGNTVSMAVKPLGPAGTYQIGYRVVSDDGHPISGSVAFTLTAAGPGAAVAAPANAPTSAAAAPAPTSAAPAPAAAGPSDAGGAPVWPWIAGAVVAVGAGVALALRLGRA